MQHFQNNNGIYYKMLAYLITGAKFENILFIATERPIN